MNATQDCNVLMERLWSYASESLPAVERGEVEEHLRTCPNCRAKFKNLQEVRGVMQKAFDGDTVSPNFGLKMGERLAAPQAADKGEYDDEQPLSVEQEQAAPQEPNRLFARLGAAPWWIVSCALHVLVIALAGLVTMAIEMPKGDDAVIMITELQSRVAETQEAEKPKELRDALASHDTPPTDPTSKEFSDVVVPPDILAKAELGDHFETINPERPDTHSAYGDPEARMFHSVTGNPEPPGGGGMGGVSLEDVIGIGGAASPGSGGGWGGGNGTGIGVQNGAGKGSFGNRNGGGRKLMVKRHGGSPATENAVDRALEWLAYHQEADGHWDSAKYAAGDACDTFCTGIALLAFLGAGHSERIGAWKDNVKRGVAWLISQQNAEGRVLKAGDKHIGYQVAVATMALSEAAGMANIKETRDAAQKAVNYCIDIHQQGEGSDKGAWRYGPKQDPDLSVSGWFIMALKSAKVAALHVDPASFEGALKFLDKVQKTIDDGKVDTAYGPVHGYGYQNPGDGVRTDAIGNLCRQFMGFKKDDLQSSVEHFVNKHGVPGAGKGKESFDLYYWYYGTLCTFQQGGDVWKKWNEGLKTTLLPIQCKDGDNAGSWNPEGAYSEKWGRVAQTAISALCMEVYYRYMMLTPDK